MHDIKWRKKTKISPNQYKMDAVYCAMYEFHVLFFVCLLCSHSMCAQIKIWNLWSLVWFGYYFVLCALCSNTKHLTVLNFIVSVQRVSSLQRLQCCTIRVWFLFCFVCFARNLSMHSARYALEFSLGFFVYTFCVFTGCLRNLMHYMYLNETFSSNIVGCTACSDEKSTNQKKKIRDEGYSIKRYWTILFWFCCHEKKS